MAKLYLSVRIQVFVLSLDSKASSRRSRSKVPKLYGNLSSSHACIHLDFNIISSPDSDISSESSPQLPLAPKFLDPLDEYDVSWLCSLDREMPSPCILSNPSGRLIIGLGFFRG